MGITSGLTLVLAAILGPRAFGVMALALAFTGFAEMLQKQGLAPAIISRETLPDRVADTAFWLVCGASLVLTGLGLGLAPLWAAANDLPELTPVIRVLSLGIPVSALIVVQESILKRTMQFRKLAVRTWLSAGVGGVVGVAGAILGWGVWALVAQLMTTNLVSVLVLWAVSPWRPKFRVDGEAARSLWSYSMRSVGASVGLFLGGRADLLIAGPLFGAVVVGLYRMANRLTALVVDVSARSMQAVSLPALAALQTDPPQFRARFLSMLRATTVLCLPVLGIVAGVAPAVEGILGDEWVGTTDAVRWLVPGQAAVTMCLLFGPALQAVGRPGLTSWLTWGWVATTVALLPAAAVTIGADRPLLALCLAVTASAILTWISHAVVASRVLDVPLAAMLGAWAPGLAGGGVGAAGSWLVMLALAGASPWLSLFAAGAAGLILAAGVVLASAPDYRGALFRRLRSGG